MVSDLFSTPGQLLSLMPKSGLCYDYQENNCKSRKIIWLVPHVIKYREESQVVTWRCNWGNTCESRCLYAMTRERGCLNLTSPVINVNSQT